MFLQDSEAKKHVYHTLEYVDVVQLQAVQAVLDRIKDMLPVRERLVYEPPHPGHPCLSTQTLLVHCTVGRVAKREIYLQ